MLERDGHGKIKCAQNGRYLYVTHPYIESTTILFDTEPPVPRPWNAFGKGCYNTLVFFCMFVASILLSCRVTMSVQVVVRLSLTQEPVPLLGQLPWWIC